MKGIVFTILNDMVEEQFGLEVWEEAIAKVNPENGGTYTAGESYADEELFAYVTALSEMSGLPASDLVKKFGEFSLGYFAKYYANFFEGMNAKEFLKSVEDVIHVEVRKLYPKAGLPTFEYEDPAENKLLMTYRSPRKLFDFAEGLIKGTANYYGMTIDIKRIGPTPEQDDTCVFDLTFS